MIAIFYRRLLLSGSFGRLEEAVPFPGMEGDLREKYLRLVLMPVWLLLSVCPSVWITLRLPFFFQSVLKFALLYVCHSSLFIFLSKAFLFVSPSLCFLSVYHFSLSVCPFVCFSMFIISSSFCMPSSVLINLFVCPSAFNDYCVYLFLLC